MSLEFYRKMHRAESRNRDSEYCRMTRSDQKEMLRKAVVHPGKKINYLGQVEHQDPVNMKRASQGCGVRIKCQTVVTNQPK